MVCFVQLPQVPCGSCKFEMRSNYVLMDFQVCITSRPKALTKAHISALTEKIYIKYIQVEVYIDLHSLPVYNARLTLLRTQRKLKRLEVY